MQKIILRQQIIMKERKNYISQEFMENYQLKEKLLSISQRDSSLTQNLHPF